MINVFCSQMTVNFVLIPSTAGKRYITPEENKMNNLILHPLSPMVEAQCMMVWSGICLKARTELVVVNGALTADGYIRNVRGKLFANARQCPLSKGSLFLRLFECRRNKNNGVAGMFSRH